jgi:phosphatidylserine/phosphatidylglycerophosphate/cardiolipin synthase-like enzyme
MSPEADRPLIHRASPGGEVIPVADRDLLPFLVGLAGTAHRRIWAAVFIIDPRPEEDPDGTVRLVLDALVRARWRGVDVRVLVGGSARTPAIELAGRVARSYLLSRGVACRQFSGRRGETSLHSKYVVADDMVIVGSHNWTRRALLLDDELSLAAVSPPLAGALGHEFEEDWARAEAPKDEASTPYKAATLPPAGPPGPLLAARIETALARWSSTWRPALDFSEEERGVLAGRLYRLAAEVAGEALDEETPTDASGVEEWAIQAARDGLRRHFGRLAAGLGQPDEVAARWVDSDPSQDPDLPVSLGRWEPRLDITEASVKEIAALPGIGPDLAAHVVQRREAGGLLRFEDLDGVPGLGPAKMDKLRPLVWVSPPGRAPCLSSPVLDAFRLSPTVNAYVEVLREIGAKRPEGAVLAAVAQAAAAAAEAPPPGGGRRPVAAEAAARVGRLILRYREIAASATAASGAAWMGLVRGSAYLDLALRLINGARKDISVVMFHAVYKAGREHPSNALSEGLVAARQRGLRVRVLLDLDRPGEVFGSRQVNQPAFDYLRAAGVEVAWDRPERLTHTKLLIVDGRDVLAGSHNWTAGSLYSYDEKSLVVRSEALAEALAGMVGP